MEKISGGLNEALAPLGHMVLPFQEFQVGWLALAVGKQDCLVFIRQKIGRVDSG